MADLKPKPKIVGFRATRDVVIATRSGQINIQAFHPVTDPRVISQLKRSKIKLQPVYSDD